MRMVFNTEGSEKMVSFSIYYLSHNNSFATDVYMCFRGSTNKARYPSKNIH